MDTVVTSDTDGILLQQYVRTQDPVAFDQIARRYRAMVFSIARRVTQSHHDAEDVAQSCFLELAKKAASIHISIPAFLHATATRRSIDLLRDKHRRLKYETKAVIDRPEPVVQPDAGERSWDEISPEVDHAIDQLPEESKTIVILYFLRGLSIADIAVETGFNRGMIERRLQVGVRRLRAELAKGSRIVSAGVLAVGCEQARLMRCRRASPRPRAGWRWRRNFIGIFQGPRRVAGLSCRALGLGGLRSPAAVELL